MVSAQSCRPDTGTRIKMPFKLSAIEKKAKHLSEQADTLWSNGKFEEAIETLKKASEIDAENWRHPYGLYIWLLQRDKFREAINYLKMAQARNPGNKALAGFFNSHKKEIIKINTAPAPTNQ